MGVVYRALDSKLDRPVAIKFLSNELADADARRRFQREAQLASALNHPHILTIHDVGEFENRQYLVAELIDGGTVREWVARERPSWRQIVEKVIGVADGLATAHEAGIVHRDIKPDNILIAKNGYAKLVDFGIAKLAASSATNRDGTAPTAVTRVGVVVGTAGYMSPEQTSGSKLDARSDIFSFAIVLYELLSGSPPFTGANDAETGRAVMHEPMPPLPGELPTALRMIVEKALEKDPADRYQTMRDLVVDLRRLARRQIGETDEHHVNASVPERRRVRTVFVVAVAIAVAVAAGVWAGSSIRTSRLADTTPDTTFRRITDFIGLEEAPAVSPDGRTVAFAATTGAKRQIWLRLLAGRPPLQLTSDDADHENPRWAPDSSSLVYFVPAEEADDVGALWEISALGGTPRRIASSLAGADLSHDGRRIAAFQRDGGETVLAILDRDGSRTGPVLGLPRNIDYQTPRWSPNDRSIAFSANASGFSWAIYVLDVASGESEALTRANDIRGLTWLPDGSGLVYASSEGSTLSYPPVFNLRRVSLSGGGEQQLTVGDVSYVEPDMAQEGRLLASRVRMQSDIWRFPVSGSPSDNAQGRRITRQTGQVQTPSVSPDGTEVAYLSDSGGHSNVWVASVDGSGTRQITFEHDPEVLIGIPLWSPAGDRIVFVRTDADGNSEWLVNPDGSGLEQLVSGVAANWSADGRWLYFSSPKPPYCTDKISVKGGPVIQVRCDAANPAISPDGTTLYFSPSSARQNELLKASPEEGPAQTLASYPISRIPMFPTGYALSPDGQWLAVPLEDEHRTNIWAIPTHGGPFRQLTDFGDRNTLITRQVSWSPDGEFIYAALVDSDADIVLLDSLPR